MEIERRLTEIGLSLPELPQMQAPARGVQVADLLFVSGSGPRRPDGSAVTGKVGRDLTIEEGYEAAKYAALMELAMARSVIGDLDRILRVVRVTGYINSAPGFNQGSRVLNGASDLLLELFGENGRHARSAVGVAELTNDIAIEVEMILQLRVER